MTAMQTNALPHCGDAHYTTGCCPKFNPDGWDGQDLHLKDKKFVHATTRRPAHPNQHRLGLRPRAGQGAEGYLFLYTTCPKCAKAYGKNYLVGVARY
jgi:hypothetical protein